MSLQALPSSASSSKLHRDRRQVLTAGIDSDNYEVHFLCTVKAPGREGQERTRRKIKEGIRTALILPRIHWLSQSVSAFWLHSHVATEPIYAIATWPLANKTLVLARASP